MEYKFKVQEAVKYGLLEAVFLAHLTREINAKRVSAENNFEVYSEAYPHLTGESRFWSIKTINEYCKELPFLGTKQVRNAIASLLKQGAIIRGFYNDNKLIRTTALALSNESVLND
jgi:hypothetical protein